MRPAQVHEGLNLNALLEEVKGHIATTGSLCEVRFFLVAPTLPEL